MSTLPHISIVEAEGKADCSACQTGVTAPISFGGIPRADMLASFVVQHSVHTKAGVASGLTPTGRPSKAALAILRESTLTAHPTETRAERAAETEENADG